MTTSNYKGLEIEVENAVATIRMLNQSQRLRRKLGPSDIHWELGTALTDLREDETVRVVVITGGEDGVFGAPGMPDSDHDPREGFSPAPPISMPDHWWRTFTGVRLTLQTLTEMEKIVVARVNGDASGFGQSIMFACDMIIAREDARILDHHMGLEGLDPYGKPFSAAPGDGGAAFVPLYMSPAKAMEYLLLAKPYTARELEQLGIINYAVPMDQLDVVVDDVVARLLQRSAYALAFTKRLVKRRVAEHLNLTLDAGIGYEWVNFLHYQATGTDVHTLESPR